MPAVHCPDAVSVHFSISLLCIITFSIICRRRGSSVQALRRNPFAPDVPCHRVVSSSLQIGGFNGTWVRDCAAVLGAQEYLSISLQ